MHLASPDASPISTSTQPGQIALGSTSAAIGDDDRRTARCWIRAIGKCAELGLVYPHMLRAAFIMAALDAGVPLLDVQLAGRHADRRTTTIYDRRPENFDCHAASVVVTYIAGA